MDKAEKARKAAREYYHRNKEKRAVKMKEWREANKAYVLNKQKENARSRKLKAIDYLGGQCIKCLQKHHPAVYEFHHRDPTTKEGDPSKMLQLSWTRLEAELNKCDLLCANCHRLVHHEETY